MFTLYTCDSETVDCRNSLEADPNQSTVTNSHHYVKTYFNNFPNLSMSYHDCREDNDNQNEIIRK